MDAPTGKDTIREADVVDTTGYDLTVKQVELMLIDAGVPRSEKTIQRWCNSGHLSAVPYQTDTGTLFKINRDSVERRIVEMQQVQAVKEGRDMSGHPPTPENNVAATSQCKDPIPGQGQSPTHTDTEKRRDMSGSENQHDGNTDTHRQPETPETRRGMSAEGTAVVEALREQLNAKDGTIATLQEEAAALRQARQADLAFYGNLREFLGAQMQDVFDERNKLRERVQELEALPPGQPSPLEPEATDQSKHDEHDQPHTTA